jgi:integral membrane protein
MTAPSEDPAVVVPSGPGASTTTRTGTGSGPGATAAAGVARSFWAGDAWARDAPVRPALTRYRIIAWTVGVGLITLVLVGVPLKYLADAGAVVAIVGPIHGVLYIVYLLATLDLATRARFSLPRTILLMLAGTIPFVSFVAERSVTHQLRDHAER